MGSMMVNLGFISGVMETSTLALSKMANQMAWELQIKKIRVHILETTKKECEMGMVCIKKKMEKYIAESSKKMKVRVMESSYLDLMK